jgi:flagellar FliJ protein
VARFRFKFQKVLDARNAVENDRRKDLMIARNQLTELEEEYCRIGGEITAQRKLFSKQRDHEENANNWALRQSYLDMLNSLQKAAAKRIERQKDVIEEKRLKLMEASRDRKAMEILRTKHYEDFVSNENRQEQLFLNEIGQFQTIRKNQENG